MTDTPTLEVELDDRYNGDPGAGLKKGDTLFVMGLSVELG